MTFWIAVFRKSREKSSNDSSILSGTLAPCSQSGFSHPRRGVAIILQILNDLLRAAYHHQGAPVPHPLHRCPAQGAEVSPLLTAEEPRPPAMQRTEPLCGAPGQLKLILFWKLGEHVIITRM